MPNKTPVNPLYQLQVDVYGEDYYAAKWNSLNPLTKLWYTIRGFNPGGRKGAPPLS